MVQCITPCTAIAPSYKDRKFMKAYYSYIKKLPFSVFFLGETSQVRPIEPYRYIALHKPGPVTKWGFIMAIIAP